MIQDNYNRENFIALELVQTKFAFTILMYRMFTT